MNSLLDSFQEAIEAIPELSQAHSTKSYLDAHATTLPLETQIQLEHQEIQQMRSQLSQNTEVLNQLRKKDTTFIQDHPSFKTTAITERDQADTKKYDEDEGGVGTQWEQLLKINHEVVVSVTIDQIEPLLRRWGSLETELSFDCLKFHLHHLDEVASSKMMRYSPKDNLHHRSQVVGGRALRSDKRLSLNIQHKIRRGNMALYLELADQQPITLVAETDYGAIVGQTSIDLARLGCPLQQSPTALVFRRPQDGQRDSSSTVFISRAFVTVQSTPIAPEMEELAKYARTEAERSPTKKSSANMERSVSPSKTLSVSPSKTLSVSPMGKRKMMRQLVKGPQQTVWLTVYDQWAYRFGVEGLNPTLWRQLVYKQLVNIKERKVELIKVEGSHYLKFLVRKDSQAKAATLTFCFNEITFHVNVLNNSLFMALPLQEYLEIMGLQSCQQWGATNKLVSLGGGQSVYAREGLRLLKNSTRQQVEDGLLATVFIKSKLQQCDLHCNQPFHLHAILHQDNGYLVTYFYQAQPVQGQLQTTLVFYLSSHLKTTKEVHVFECMVKQREVTRETVRKEMTVARDDCFARLSMKMIISQNIEYWVRSIDPEKVTVVNGTAFQYQNHSQEYLTLQLLYQPDSPWQTDLIFDSPKGRSFFLRLAICPV